MPPAVAVTGLGKRFGSVRAADDVTFTIARQEFFSLLGPSGCGKTTTLRCVAGLESADEGAIRIGEHVVFDAACRIDVPPNRRGIGMVFQSYAVWPHMSVADNIAYPLKVQGVARSGIRERVTEVLAILGMTGLGERRPSQLSGGQQQRVALGRALALNPTVLLLDEPLSNLDAKLREQMRAELKQIQRHAGLPILYVTHDQSEALAMSDRMAVMNEGRIHQLAPPEEVYRRPATRFVLDFIGTVNYLPCRIVGTDGTRVRLDLDGGAVLTIPRPPYIPQGDRALLAVRPEDFVLGRAGRPADVEVALAATVTLRSFLGASFEFRLAWNGNEIRVVADKDFGIADGDTVALGVREGLLLEPDALSRPDARAS